MSKNHSFIDTIDQIVTDGVQRGILHLSNTDLKLTGNKISINEKEVINFGSCSYLGLEFDSRLIQGACEAVKNYGTQFSESRAYVSLKLYKDLEDKFEKIFSAPVIVTPTTTLGHIACIPVVVSNADAVIVDHQAHNSIQIAVSIVKSKGTYSELIRHNRIDLLEERIIELRKKHEKIWYMADGVYSMFGDVCPVQDIIMLMEKYPELHFYVDDAHGMSVFGNNGRGYVLSQTPIHARMIVATSLAKAFATGGAVLVFPDKETARKVRTCGGPLITSGPLQPATLGAAIASADIHLSSEISKLQEELQDKIRYTRLILEKYQLPVISNSQSPVFFIAVSLPKIGYKMIEKMLESGYYLNLGIFPAVPIKNTGIRFTITRLHSFTQIDMMIEKLAFHFHRTLEEENFSLNEIYKAFKLPNQNSLTDNSHVNRSNKNISAHQYSQIRQINKNDWNSCMSGDGLFDYAGMQFLEDTFTCNLLPENNWTFDYLIIKDNNNKIILSTFFTSALWKEDMLSSHDVSQLIEQKRLHDPYLYTGRILMMGSLFSEGKHLYIDEQSEYLNEALTLFFKTCNSLQEKYECSSVLLRDFAGVNEFWDKKFIDEGFFRITMPQNHSLSFTENFQYEDWMNRLSTRSKKHLRQDILKHESKFIFKQITNAEEAQIEHWYQLYLNVKNRSLELNTFTLPFKLFKKMAQHPNWQITTLSLRSEANSNQESKEVAVMFTYLSEKTANFMLIGIDYAYQKEYHCYRQALYQVILYNLTNGIKKINLGFSASFEKKKLGAEVIPTFAYMQLKDNFNMQAIEEEQGMAMLTK